MEWGQKKEGRGRIAEGPGDEEIKTEEYEGTSAWFNFVNLFAQEILTDEIKTVVET